MPDARPEEIEGDLVLDPDTPLAELPGISVPWPDDVQLPQLAPLDPEGDIVFPGPLIEPPVRNAELGPDGDPGAGDPIAPDEEPVLAQVPPDGDVDGDGLPERTALAEPDTDRISDELYLAFPDETSLFPERSEFVRRFSALSTVRMLDDEDDTVAQLAARARQDELLLVELLRIYGYYDAQVLRNVGQNFPGELPEDTAQRPPQVRFDILPGRRYTYGRIDLGQLEQAVDGAALRAAFEIQPGDYLQNDDIVRERADLDSALGALGYPFAEIDDPELLVDHARFEGDLTMPVRPNGKYAFGNVVSLAPDFLSGGHLETISRFDEGEIYERELELDLRRAILATGLVSAVTITPVSTQEPVGDQPGVVDLQVGLTPAKLRTIAGAIGYGTEEGFRIQGSWEHRNLFPPEGALRVRGILGTREQLAGVTFRRNNFKGRDQALTLDAFVSTFDSEAYDANTAQISARFERVSTILFQKPVSYSIGAEIIATDERESDSTGATTSRSAFFIGALPATILFDNSDSLLDPTKGFRVGGRLSPEYSYREGGPGATYVRTQIDGSYYQPFGNIVAAGRVRLASIPGADLTSIAPSRRLYAGGGGSVRGYGYQQIGPRNTAGDPSGGRSLIEFSAEARIRTGLLNGMVSIVPFVDAGSVSRSITPDFGVIKYGVGIGARYHTGFGPLRFDIATPLNPGPDDGPVAVYISLGQAF